MSSTVTFFGEVPVAHASRAEVLAMSDEEVVVRWHFDPTGDPDMPQFVPRAPDPPYWARLVLNGHDHGVMYVCCVGRSAEDKDGGHLQLTFRRTMTMDSVKALMEARG